MNKSNHFTGQPLFSQLIKFIPKEIIAKAVSENGAGFYCKKFNTWNHLITMLFSCYRHCTSLREVTTGMRAMEGKLLSAGVHYFPARSTFSDANKRRDATVFQQIYYGLKQYWQSVLSDSSDNSSTYIIDSTTISLFQEIFKGAGMSKASGKRKGGLKVHTSLKADDYTANLIHITDGARNDLIFLSRIQLPSGSTVIMDRGYLSFKVYSNWTENNIRFVTRLKYYTYVTILDEYAVNLPEKNAGIEKDQLVRLGHPAKYIQKVNCRLICFKDPLSGKLLKFLTNDLKSNPLTIANLYKKRWKIELLFKRLKQNMPLNYFLGDNQNAIKIQIWCALIADLLLQIIQRQVKRKWAFSNITSLIRLHLFNYLNLISFLENPEKCIITLSKETYQTQIKFSG